MIIPKYAVDHLDSKLSGVAVKEVRRSKDHTNDVEIVFEDGSMLVVFNAALSLSWDFQRKR